MKPSLFRFIFCLLMSLTLLVLSSLLLPIRVATAQLDMDDGTTSGDLFDRIPPPITDFFIPAQQVSAGPPTKRSASDFIGRIYAPKPEDWKVRSDARPITGVTVTIMSGSRTGESITTDKNGYYLFPNVRGDELILRVEKEHFEPKEVIVHRFLPTKLANGAVLNYPEDVQQNPGSILMGQSWPDEVRFLFEETLVVHDLLYVEGGALGAFYSRGVIVMYSHQFAKWQDSVSVLVTFAHEIAHARQHALVSVDGSAWGIHDWNNTPEGIAYREAREKDWNEVGKAQLDMGYDRPDFAGNVLTETAAETMAYYWSVDRWGGRPHYGDLRITAPNRFKWAAIWLQKQSERLQPLSKILGDNQAGLSNTLLPLPFAVVVRNLDDGFPLSGVPVTFTVTAGGGTLSTTRTTTNLSGIAESTLTLGPNFGTNTVEVSAEGLTVTFNAVADAPVDIPDRNLRAAIEEALDKAPGTPIAPAEMANLELLRARNANISDLTGLENATNLQALDLTTNSFANSTVSDLSPLSGLTSLTGLWLENNSIVDISPIEGLTNLIILALGGNNISDISAVSGLTNLGRLVLGGNNISDISAVSDLTNLEVLWLSENNITGLSGLAGLTNLGRLGLGGNNIMDISELAGLTNLTRLWLWGNNISDISPLVANAGLGSGDEVDVKGNPLNRASIETHIPALESRGVTVEFDNRLEMGPNKITGPWLWMIAPTAPGQGGARSNNVDSLAAASGGDVTEAEVAANGAKEGDVVGNYVWTLGKIRTVSNNINDVINRIEMAQGDVNDHSSYAHITLESATAQPNVTMRVGSDDSIKVWLNGEVVHNKPVNRGASDFQDSFKVNLKKGDNLLLVKVSERDDAWSMFVGIEADVNAIYKRPPAELVVIPDANLRAAIERALGKESGESITEADMENLTELFARDASISDLTGLEHATNLTSLFLYGNSISNIASLAALTNLTSLELSRNSILDISHVAGLTELTSLEFWGNNISDISAVSRLTNLMHLHLSSNNISDLSPLVANTGLGSGDEVYVKGNPLSDVSIHTHIPALEARGVTVEYDGFVNGFMIPDANLRAAIERALQKEPGEPITEADMENLFQLFAQNRGISDLTGLEAAINLQSLWLSFNNISDLSPLSELTNLQSLELSFNNISDLSELAGLTNLQWLILGNNSILNLSPLSELTNLQLLELGGNPLTLSSLPSLTNLAHLSLWDANISDLSPLSELTNLQSLVLGGNPLLTLSSLPPLTNLAHLSLWDANISDLSPLSRLPNLKVLELSDNPLSNLAPLSNLTNLETLFLKDTNISDLSPLSGLPNLRELNLEGTNITDLSPLVANTGLGAGDIVRARGLPLSPLSIQTQIPILQDRGVVVFHEAVEKAVHIPDRNLHAAIARSVSKEPNTIITDADMGGLRSLFAQDRGISDLSGMEHATYLEGLWLDGNNITDISAVAGLTNLTGLALGENSIKDISAVAELTQLTRLALWSNNITDISAVAGLTNLTWLDLGVNSILDISPVIGLTNLTELDLRFNLISDISAVSKLTNLESLDLWSNNISDLSPLTDNTGLGAGDTVWVNENPLNRASIETHIPALKDRGVTVEYDDVVTELVVIPDPNLRAAIEMALGKALGDPITASDMATLTELEAPNANISNLTGLEGATNLTRLNLGGEFIEEEEGFSFFRNSNSVSDLSPLSGLTNLTSLVLDNNAITDISAVSELTNLTSLVLDNNAITDISAVSGLTNLTALGLNGNAITDISAVSELTNLTSLSFSSNSIRDISPVAGLTNLTRVNLWDNTISDISTMAGLTNLELLNLGRNAISDISPVSGLTNLTLLWLGSNSISDLSPLVANTGLGSGDTVDVKENPLNYASIHTHIPTLQERGVDVEFNDRIPTTLLKISGDDQKGVYGETLTHPFVVEVQDGNGDVFEGVPVTFDVTAGGGTFSITSPTTDENGRAESIFTLGNNVGVNTISVSAAEIQGTVTFNAVAEGLEFDLSVPMGTSLIHVPLKVTAVDGVAKTITSIADLYDVLGGTSTVNFLISYDSATQEWLSYFVPSDKDTLADRRLTDDMGIIAGMKAPSSLRLSGIALGTDGTSTITLNQGLNLVGIPLRDERINRVSDLLRLDGIWGNVSVITLIDGGKFKVVGRAGDPGDIAITGGGAFILSARQTVPVVISGEAWTNVSGAAAAPLVTRKGIEVGDATPVLALRGSVVDEEAGLKVDGFRVTVKNFSTGRAVATVTTPDEAGYQLTVVDIEMGRAAAIGDTLEISAQSPSPFIGVEPLRYTVTAEDVKRSLIQLPELVAYEIPVETQLLSNYPNPFNPETWIPYRLAEDAFVTLTIYALNGQVVRTIDVGHQPAAVYERRSKAVYWDGRNEWGETVASGIYFYHLSAGDYSATRRMIILK